MPLYGDIDLHASNSVIVLLNEQDEVIYQKRLPNDLTTILGQSAPYHTELQGIVVELTYGLQYTDDHSDVRWLESQVKSNGNAGP